MTTICQNAGTLTTTTLRTIQTVYVATSIQQMAGLPTTSTIVGPTSSCNTATIGSTTTVRCATYTSSRVTVITPAPSQVPVIMTLTNQIVQTQLNTLFGTLCHTVGPGQPTPPGVTDTTYTTEYFTVSGSGPSAPTPLPSNSLSQSTVFSDPTSEPDPSGTAGSSQSGSSNVPVAAIAGGAVGGVVVAILLGFLVYFLFFKKSIAADGYKAPGEESPSIYHDNSQSDVFSSEQTGYYAQGYDGQGPAGGQPSGQPNPGQPQSQGSYPTQYADGGQPSGQPNPGQPQLQGSYPTQYADGGQPSGQPTPGQPQLQGSYPTQYADGGQGAHYLQSQGGGNMYANTQGAQYPSVDMNQVPFNTASGVFPAAAAAGVVLPVVAAASLSRYSSSSSPPPASSVGQYSPQSQLSTIPLVHHGSPHQHPMSHTATPVPYRGYAEPADG